jgi:hypothetical protein
MDSQIIAIFCVCDDLLKALGHVDHPQREMTDAEVMTTALIAALYYGGNFEPAREMLAEQGYIPQMLGKSRFNRRLHALADEVWSLFGLLGEVWKDLNTESVYIIDSFPIATCDNIRIWRSRRYQGEDWRGKQASKKRYFYGLKLHLLVTPDGRPVEFFLTPGEVNDVRALKMYAFDVPEGAWITADKAYTDYAIEDVFEAAARQLSPLRKKNSLRPKPPWVRYMQETYRKLIETTGSRIERLLPKHIHAVTPQGFELKLALFVLAASCSFLDK